MVHDTDATFGDAMEGVVRRSMWAETKAEEVSHEGTDAMLEILKRNVPMEKLVWYFSGNRCVLSKIWSQQTRNRLC
jgi:hypothetical protein